MNRSTLQGILTTSFLVLAAVNTGRAAPLEYPIVYLSAEADEASRGPAFRTPSAGDPFRHLVADLVLRTPEGKERTLVEGRQPEKGLLSILDPCVSLDGKKVYYSHIYESPEYYGRHADLYCVEIRSGQITRLTDGPEEWTPPRGGLDYAPHWPRDQQEASTFWKNKRAIYQTGVWNTAPCEVAGGRLVFTSTRAGVQPTKEKFTAPQLYVMDTDGQNVEKIGFMNLGGALHPVVGHDGRVYFSSGEMQGHRGNGGNGWAIWSIDPDGTNWAPEISGLGPKDPWHFQAVTSDGSVVASQYYDTRSFGTLFVAPPFKKSADGTPTMFGPPDQKENPKVANGYARKGSHKIYHTYPFQRQGMYSLAPWASTQDYLGVNLEGETVGMISHPAATPDNGLLLCWTGDQGDRDLGIYFVPDVTQPALHFSELVRIADREDRFEFMPRAVLSYEEIYGHPCPSPQGLETDDLPDGSPFAVVGTSSMNWREVTAMNRGGMRLQGGNVKPFDTEDIEYLAILLTNPTLSVAHSRSTHYAKIANAYGGETNVEGFSSEANERLLRFKQLIPLKKHRLADGGVHYGPHPPPGAEPIMDPAGGPDTSFAAELPADQAWTFQLLDKDGRALTTAQTWHQVRPGEKRVDCNGCHAHHEPTPFRFEETFAATNDYDRLRLTEVELVEYYRDVKPIVDKHQLDLNDRPWQQRGDDLFLMSFRSRELDWLMDDKFTDQERATLAAWIDTGMLAAVEHSKYSEQTGRVQPESGRGPFADTQPPTLNLAQPTRVNDEPVREILLGAFDPQSGLDVESITVAASWPVQDRAPGANLADLFRRNKAEWMWRLATDVPAVGEVTISVKDKAGNETRIVRSFRGMLATGKAR